MVTVATTPARTDASGSPNVDHRVGHPGDRAGDQEHAEPRREQRRPDGGPAHREQPEAEEDPAERVAVRVQVEQQQGRRGVVRRVGRGDQGTHLERQVDQDGAGADRDEHQQGRAGAAVHVVEQPEQREAEEHEDDGHEDVRHQAEPEQRLVLDDPGGGRGGVPRHVHGSARDELRPGAEHGEQEVEDARGAREREGSGHGSCSRVGGGCRPHRLGAGRTATSALRSAPAPPDGGDGAAGRWARRVGRAP